MDDYREIHSERGFRAGPDPMLTIYWPPARPTPVLQLNRSAVDLMAPTDAPLLVAVLLSLRDPTQLALEHRATGLKLSAARQASGGRLVNLVTREQCPVRVPLSLDPDHPGRLLGTLLFDPESRSADGSSGVTAAQRPAKPPGREAVRVRVPPAPVTPPAPSPAPVLTPSTRGSDAHGQSFTNPPTVLTTTPSPVPVRSSVAATLELAQHMTPANLTPAPTPEELMDEIIDPDGDSPDGDDEGDDDDE